MSVLVETNLTIQSFKVNYCINTQRSVLPANVLEKQIHINLIHVSSLLFRHFFHLTLPFGRKSVCHSTFDIFSLSFALKWIFNYALFCFLISINLI